MRPAVKRRTVVLWFCGPAPYQYRPFQDRPAWTRQPFGQQGV